MVVIMRMYSLKLISNVILKIILFFLISLNGILAYAAMPKSVCNSICSTSSLSKEAHCILLDKKYKMYYRTSSNNSQTTHTMIFSSGTGFPADGWFETNIAGEMARKVRVFTYDRIYTHNSCPNINNFMPNTAQEVVNQLHQLLKQENIKPPYILVGQSIGGLYMQLFAREFPDEVAGLLLMDSVTSEEGPAVLNNEVKDFFWRNRLAFPLQPDPANPLYNEIIGQLPSYLELMHAPPLQKNIPLIVMYATKQCLPKIGDEKQICMGPKEIQAHYEAQLAVYNMSIYHKLIRVDGEHMSFFDPDKHKIVIDALNSILEMSQQRAAGLLKKQLKCYSF